MDRMLFIRLNPFRHHVWFTIHKLKMSSVVGISVEIFFYVLTLEVLPSCGPFWKTDTIYETFEITEGQRNFEEIVFDFVANLVATTRPFVQQLVKAYIETSKPLKFCTWHDSCALVSCVKFCSDMISYDEVILKLNFWITKEKSFVEQAPVLWHYIIMRKDSTLTSD